MENHLKAASQRPTGPVGVHELAEALGISRGTIDRALHGRAGVSPATRKKVLKMAKRLGYRPNLAARYLSSRKHITIGVSIPLEIAYFYDDIREGIFEAAGAFEQLGVRLLYRPFPLLGQGEVEAFQEILKEDIQGLVISPGYPDLLVEPIRKAVHRGIPVVCVATDAPGTERLASVSVDPLTNGCMAGELMGQFLPRSARVIVFTGMRATVDHAEKVRGFRQSFPLFCPGGEIADVVEAHDEETEAYEKCRRILQKTRATAGIYVSTANSLPVVKAVRDLGLSGKIKVICTDLFPALVPLIESGQIAATIYQRPREQGQVAFQTILRYVTEGTRPSPRINLDPAIVMRSNLSLFLQRSGRSDGQLRV